MVLKDRDYIDPFGNILLSELFDITDPEVLLDPIKEDAKEEEEP